VLLACQWRQLRGYTQKEMIARMGSRAATKILVFWWVSVLSWHSSPRTTPAHQRPRARQQHRTTTSQTRRFNQKFVRDA